MTRFRKRKKIFRKFIKRLKNRFQRVRKFCRMHTLPVLVAVGIMVSVIFASYQNAYATGLEEYFYYTYFDLMSGLFAETGMDFGLKDDYYTKSDRVSGKQVWDNFCTWVENKAKVAALPVEVVNKAVFDELKNLPNTVTSAGAEMSEKLSELLAKILPTFGTDSFSSLTENSLLSFLHATSDYDILPAVSSYLDAFNQDLSNGYKLNVVKDENEYFLFVSDPAYSKLQYIQDKSYSYPVFRCYGYKGNSRREIDVSRIYSSPSSKQVGVGAKIRATEPVWIVKEGNYVASDGTSINDYAKVKKVDDNTVYVPGVGYKTNWDILKDILNDRVTTDAEEEAWNSRYNFDNDNKDDKEKKKKDNEKDKLPVAIPIIPFKKPDSTEKDTEKDTEKGTESDVPGKDPDPSKNPMINPDTGHYIDPDTGYDIDPDTGKLIDPDTGELIEPDIPSTAGKAGNWKRLFPFCIPWDMMELIKSMKADKKAPVFEFKYTFKAVNYTWVVKVDMADYWKYIKIFRWGLTIFFIIGLFFLTVKFTTFVQRMGG
jgi:hypothetical protein